MNTMSAIKPIEFQNPSVLWPMKKGAKVLVADTASIDSAHLKLMLDREGFQVEIVKDGKSVLDEVNKKSYDLVFINKELNGMSGLEVIKGIRFIESATGRHLPIIGISNYSIAEDKRNFSEVGVDGSLAKPLYKPQLFKVIDEVMVKTNPE